MKSRFKTAMRIFAIPGALALCALLGCSDYFTPWSAFRGPEYHFGSGAFVPQATLLAVPDSETNTTATTSTVWYSFAARKDTTYVIRFYPQLSGEVLDIFDTATQNTVASMSDSSSGSAFWVCKRDGLYFLRIQNSEGSLSSYAPGPGPFRLSIKTFDDAFAGIVDIYEPDSAKNLAARISFSLGNAGEVFQLHRIAPGDTDWFVFSPNYSHSYVIRTIGSVDTKIRLLAPATDSVVMEDDNSGGGKNAELFWTCPYSSGSYARYFSVVGATEGVYGISIVQQQ